MSAGDAARAKVRRFVTTYVVKGRYGLYPDAVVVENVIEGLAANLEAHGKMYCPCAPLESAMARGSELVCPCTPHHADIARQGYCDCALFASREFIAAEAAARVAATAAGPSAPSLPPNPDPEEDPP